MKPLVAVVGRPNVGKSTFINRLVGNRAAIVDDMPGVTRDRQYLDIEWLRDEFVIIDTGGIIADESDTLLKEVQAQVRLAISEADVIVFLVDGRDGVTAVDLDIADELRYTKKPIVLAVNKIDNDAQEILSSEFYELNMGDPITISAYHGTGINTVLDAIAENLPEYKITEETENLKIAIVGRPNVGKSSILNAIIGVDRMIVHDSSGTTRDAIDSIFTYYGKEYTLIDTAGIRRKARVDYGVEQFSVVRSIKSMERADAVLIVIDATTGATEQDQRIAGMAEDKGKACVIIVNKWDLIEKNDSTQKTFTDELRFKLHFIKYAPIIFTSAVTKKRLFNIFEVVNAAVEENSRRITTGLLNQVVNEAMALNPPPFERGKSPRIYYSTQAGIVPPTFILFTNNSKLFSDSYIRYLENKLREAFSFSGTPIRFIMRNKERDKR
ncbi:MAG: ribosome biogenesis GTPase Der [Candidatus Sericytochromatia bacterium]|nr:ribosome biogenesis GTPase Der [Candidatus Sericytochromatia bacterium]